MICFFLLFDSDHHFYCSIAARCWFLGHLVYESPYYIPPRKSKYSCIIKLKSLFVCLNALMSETTSLNSKNLFVLDSPFVEEGYRLYNITLRQKGAEQLVKPRWNSLLIIIANKIKFTNNQNELGHIIQSLNLKGSQPTWIGRWFNANVARPVRDIRDRTNWTKRI